MSAAKTAQTAQVFAPQVFTIAAGAPFADLIARQLLAETAGDRLRLADVTLLLPNRRATRTLSEAFLRESGGQATVLPRLVPLGDLAADELAFQAEEPGTAAGLSLDLRPAIGEVRRRFLLSHLVRKWLQLMRPGQGTAAAAVLALADDLARLLDELGTHQVSMRQIEELVPERFAAHWQDSVVFLDILRRTWPAILADEKLVDPAQRRNAILSATGALWQRQPPGPIVAAGSTGSIPAVAQLLAVVARLPQGRVVLPGLDEELHRGEVLRKTVAADPQHPQYGLVRLLGELGIEPKAVQRWPGSPAPGPRHDLLSLAFRPPVMTDGWRQQGEAADETQRALWRRGLAGLVWLDCPHPRGEAEAIALALRRTLRRPGKTAALVTPDRGLARRVAAELGRWSLVLNDSAGQPLTRTPPMVLLSLLATAAAEGLAPVALTALLKHPLASGGLQPAAFRREARRLERLLLRGPRPAAGATGLLRALRHAVEAAQQPWQREQLGRLRPWLARVLRALRPFLRLFGEASGPLPLTLLLDAHLAAAEALAKSNSASGANRLWSGDDGEAASLALAEIRAEAARLDPIPAADYPALFDALLAGRAVRPRWGSHPRLFLWGPLEARLQAPDLTILAGLNEGTWPAAVDPGPWLNRPMREALGLPSPEQRVGQAAHDLWQGLSARRVLLTRAAKAEGTPTRPARWLLRLAALAKSLGIERSLRRYDAEALGLADGLDRAAEVPPPAIPPAPRPPLEARPRKLPVTAVEMWMRNPYALYAKRILRLEKLDPLDEDPGAPERGQLVHGLLEAFVRAHPGRIGDGAESWLHHELERLLRALDDRPGLALTWRPRLRRAMQNFLRLERERRPELRGLIAETTGSITLAGPAGPFELTAKADRLELRRDGAVTVVDYKTGKPPKQQDVVSGLAAQLPLEAAMVLRGGFAGVTAASVAALEIWRLGGGRDDGITSYPGGKEAKGATPDDLAASALEGLCALIARFDDPATPYLAHPRPGSVRYDDYAHLARVGEWQVKEDEP
jgi:ATP-dependent helicase/nuclease subunit B